MNLQGFSLWKNMAECEGNIKSNCNFSISTSEQSNIDTCNKVMGDFRTAAEV